MFRLNYSLFLSLVFIVFAFVNCSSSPGSNNEPVFKEIPELAAIKPDRPVKIKVKRNASGSYSWEIQGADTENIIEADRKLRQAIRD